MHYCECSNRAEISGFMIRGVEIDGWFESVPESLVGPATTQGISPRSAADVASIDTKFDTTDPTFPPCERSIYDKHNETATPQVKVPFCHCGTPCKRSAGDQKERLDSRPIHAAHICPKPSSPPIPSELNDYFSCKTATCRFYRRVTSLIPYATLIKSIRWIKLKQPQYCLVHPSGFKPSAIRQGKLGDCWFLSALCVLAETQSRTSRLFGTFDEDIFTTALFINGRWKTITIDRFFPILGAEEFPLAFARSVNNELWVPVIEKAYAKAYGSYSRISGGWVQEALFDLTGCPVESFDLRKGLVDPEFAHELWSKLLSFKFAKFVMGCGTSFGTFDGLVGCHAYSILDVVELREVVVGKQFKIQDFFGAPKPPTCPEQIV